MLATRLDWVGCVALSYSKCFRAPRRAAQETQGPGSSCPGIPSPYLPEIAGEESVFSDCVSDDDYGPMLNKD